MQDELPKYLERELDLLGVVSQRMTPRQQPQEKQKPAQVWDGKGDCPF